MSHEFDTYSKGRSWSLPKVKVEETLAQRGDRALLALLWAIENLSHVIGFSDIELLNSSLLQGDRWLLFR